MMKHYGFTLVELMVVIVIFLIIFAAIYGVLSMGWQSWHTGNTHVELQQETRKAMDKMVMELRESGSGYVSITGGGSVITFQVPVDWDNEGIDLDGDGIADVTGDVIDNNGNIERGAPLHLSCRKPHCEGQDDNCHYQNYAISYLVGNNQLLRRVLDGYPAGNQVGADAILANNIRSDNPPPNALNFGDPAGDLTSISIEVTAQKDTVEGRTMQSTLYSQVTLRN